MSEKERVEFKPPADFSPPENADPEKDWDMVCSFRSKPDGSICMTKLGDCDLPGYGSKEKEGKDHDEKYEHKPDYGEYVDKLGLSEGMGEGGAPSPSSYNS